MKTIYPIPKGLVYVKVLLFCSISFLVSFSIPVVLFDVEIQSDSNVLCEGDMLRLSVIDTFSTYEWKTNPPGDVLSDTSFVDITEAGTYIVLVTDSEGNTGTGSIEIESSKVFSTIFTDFEGTKICKGESITLTAYGGGNVSVPYEWTTPEQQFEQSITVTPDTTTTYEVIITNFNNCKATEEITIEVFDQPIDTLVPFTDTVCAYTNINIEVSDLEGNSFSWTNNETSNVNSFTVGEDNVNMSVTITNEGGCTETLTFPEIEVVDKGTIEFISSSGDYVFASGESGTFEVSDENVDPLCPIMEYKWNVDGNESTTTAPTINVNFNQPNKTYIDICVTGIDECGCETETYCREIDISDNSTWTVEFGNFNINESYCIGDEITIFGNANPVSGQPFSGSQWKINGNNVDGPFDETNFEGNANTPGTPDGDLNVEFKKSGTFNVSWVVFYNGGVDSRTKSVQIEILPNPTYELVYDSDILCEGDQFSFTANGQAMGYYNYLLVFVEESQNNITISNLTENTYVFNNAFSDTTTIEFVNLIDNVTGCNALLDDDLFVGIYNEMVVELDTFCNDEDGSYIIDIMPSEGSGEYNIIGNVDSEGITDLVTEGNSMFVAVEDKKCPDFNQSLELDVVCSCKEVAPEIISEDFEGCVGQSIRVDVEGLPVRPNGDENVLYYQLFKLTGAKEKVDTSILDLIITSTDTFFEVHWDESLEPDVKYGVQAFISIYNSGNDINYNYNCIQESLFDGNNTTVLFNENPTLNIVYPDTVCLNQYFAIFRPNGLPEGNTVSWEVPSGQGIEYENLGNNSIHAHFTESGDKVLFATQKFSVENATCFTTEEISVHVTDEEAPELININYFPSSNIFSAETDEYDCFQWARVNKSTGNVVLGPNTIYWQEAAVNLDQFIYYLDYGNCNSECRTRVFYNSDGPLSTEMVDDKDRIVVSPNPSNGLVFVHSEIPLDNINVTMYNALGENVISEFDSIDNHTLQIDGTKLVDGIYLLALDINGQMITKKIVIH